MYVTPNELAEAVIASQQEGRITEDFARILIKMVEGVARRYGFDPDDLYGEVFITVTRLLPRLDPTRNLFQYLSETIRMERANQWRDARYFQKTCLSIWQANRRTDI